MELKERTQQFNENEQLEQLTHKKMNLVFCKTSEVLRAKVILYENSCENLENQYCEINLNVLGNTIFVKKNAAAYEQAIRLAVSAIEKIIRRQKIGILS